MVTLRLPKTQIMQVCMDKQQQTIADFEHEILALKQQLRNHEETDSQETRPSPERRELLLRMEHELNFLNYELEVLKSINLEEDLAEIELGAVVVTDQRVFFISVSIERVDVLGEAVIGVSTKSPIYHSMQGKKTGEYFDYGGVRFTILDVY